MVKEYKGPYPYFNEIVKMSVDIVQKQALDKDVFGNPDGQIAVQTTDPDVIDWHAGVGKSMTKTPAWEHMFCHIQPSLRGSVVEDYINWLGVPVYRTRIMLARPKSSYSIHKDYSPRLHLPLVTNDQCYFVFKDPAELIHMPADGKTYWVDTRKPHTFMNGSMESRLHLVMIVKE